jgi:hypothetical protein
MDSYFHIYIVGLENTKFKGDINFSQSADLCIRIKYMGFVQDSKVLANEKGSAMFREPLILENAEPDPTGESKLVIEIYDYDTITSDDFLAYCQVEIPTEYATNFDDRRIQLLSPNGEECGTIVMDQIHFIKQKVRRYRGACKCLCCCLISG